MFVSTFYHLKRDVSTQCAIDNFINLYIFIYLFIIYYYILLYLYYIYSSFQFLCYK